MTEKKRKEIELKGEILESVSKLEYSLDSETLTMWFEDGSGQMFKLDRAGGIPLDEDPETEEDEDMSRIPTSRC